MMTMSAEATARLLNGSGSCALRVRLDSAVDGLHASSRLLASDLLATVHETVVEQDLHETKLGSPLLTRDNPLLPQSAMSCLDPAGLIKPGTSVAEDAVLASVVRFTPVESKDADPPAPGTGRATDLSVRLPRGWGGASVEQASYQTRAEMDQPARGIIGRIRVMLRLINPLSIGDALVLGRISAVIAGAIESADADLLVGASLAARLGVSAGPAVAMPVAVAEQTVRWSLQARATGPYSLITNQPLGGKERTPGQALEPAFVHTLRQAGLSANLTELLTLKSDDVGNRPALQAALAGQGPFPTPGAPASVRVLTAHLTGLGLAATLGSAGDHISLSLAPMTDRDRLALSSGQVKKPETINFRTFKPEPGGIMCEQVFGPEEHPDRSIRFGHIELTDPVVPYLYRTVPREGGGSVLAQLLRLSDQDISGLLSNELQLDEGGSLVACDPTSASCRTGAAAIEELLNRVPDDALPASIQGHAGARSAIAARSILVIPPNMRPLVLLENGNFATSDLNDLYRRVINRSNRLRKLRELNAPPVILHHERRMLQKAVDSLFANTFLPRSGRVLGSSNRPLKGLLEFLLAHATQPHRKRVDYSARARAVPSSTVGLDAVLVPRSIAATLGLPENGPVLLTRDRVASEHATPVTVLRARPHDASVIALHPAHAVALFDKVDGIPECVLHRPLTPQAVDEAASFVGKVVLAPHRAHKSWMDNRDPLGMAAHLLDAAMRARPIPFDSPAGLLLAGPGITAFSPVTAPRKREEPS